MNAAQTPSEGRPSARPPTYEQWRELLRDVPLPAAVVDLDAFDRNTDWFARVALDAGGSHTLRLATKSVRVPALIRRVLEYGRPYRGLMCFAAAEAEFLAGEGLDDLFVAYPTRRADDLAALRRTHERGATVRLVVDSLDGARAISEAMAGVERPFRLALDVDMSLRLFGGRVHLGVRRSPIRTVEQAIEFFRGVGRLPNVECRAVMGYEAQVAGLADRNPFKRRLNPVFRWVRSKSIPYAADLRRRLVESLAKEGVELELFNGGGSGSIDTSVAEPWLTEATVGSGLVCSHLFSYFSNISPDPACFFALQATRSSDPGYITCAGGGYIASGEPGWDKTPTPYLPEGLRLVGTEGCGEVQTPLYAEKDCPVRVGDPVLFRHAKAGELAERFNTYLLTSGGKIVGEAPTYRGLGKCFL